jgi:type I restriction enzyme, S subunit
MTEDNKKKVNSEDGITKSAWKEFQPGDVVDIFDGPHTTPKKTLTGDIFLGISNLINGRIDLTGVEYLSADDYRKWTRRVEPCENDIVFSYETKLGDAALIPSGLRFCLGRRMGLLRAWYNS